jgi:dTDP-4-dehydrorhamnose reductase
LGELAVTNLLDNYIIARACWMFGGGPGRDRKFVSKIIGQLNNPEIAAVNDVYGSPTFGKDLAAAIKEFLMRDATGIYHLSNGGIATRYEVAKKIIEVFNSSVRIVPVASDHFISDAKRAKNESLVSRLNIMRPWQEALEDYLETEWKPVVGLRNEA